MLLFRLVHWYASIIAARIKLRKYIMNVFLEDRDATITTKVLPKNPKQSRIFFPFGETVLEIHVFNGWIFRYRLIFTSL